MKLSKFTGICVCVMGVFTSILCPYEIKAQVTSDEKVVADVWVPETAVLLDEGIFSEEVEQDVVVKTDNIWIKDMTVPGEIIVSTPSYGDENRDVLIENVDIKGGIRISDETNSRIILKNSTCSGPIVVTSSYGSELYVEKDTVIDVKKGAKITISGNVSQLNIEAGSQVTLKRANVANITLNKTETVEELQSTKLIVEKSSVVKKVQTYCDGKIVGDGEISEVIVGANGLSINKEPTTISLSAKDIVVNVAGSKIDSSTLKEYNSKDKSIAKSVNIQHQYNGYIVDAKTKEPISNVEINLIAKDDENIYYADLTNDEGMFAIYVEDISKEYDIEIIKQNVFSDGRIDYFVKRINVRDLYANNTIEFEESENNRAKKIDVTVVDKDNKPVDYAHIFFEGKDIYWNPHIKHREVRSIYVENCELGEYTFTVELDSDGEEYVGTKGTITLVEEQNKYEVTFKLDAKLESWKSEINIDYDSLRSDVCPSAVKFIECDESGNATGNEWNEYLEGASKLDVILKKGCTYELQLISKCGTNLTSEDQYIISEKNPNLTIDSKKIATASVIVDIMIDDGNGEYKKVDGATIKVYSDYQKRILVGEEIISKADGTVIDGLLQDRYYIEATYEKNGINYSAAGFGMFLKENNPKKCTMVLNPTKKVNLKFETEEGEEIKNATIILGTASDKLNEKASVWNGNKEESSDMSEFHLGWNHIDMNEGKEVEFNAGLEKDNVLRLVGMWNYYGDYDVVTIQEEGQSSIMDSDHITLEEGKSYKIVVKLKE